MVWCICFPESLQLISNSLHSLCKCGPNKWAEKFSLAAGSRQSPIDIRTDEVVPDPKLGRNPLRWTYPKDCTEIINTGYCWKVHVQGEGSVLEGGPLSDKYQLEQFHCHWGSNSSHGSEHLVDGEAYAAEVHFVHWNTKYGSFNEALKHGDGLAVLGVFLKVGKANQELTKLVDALNDIKHKDENVGFRDVLDPARLLPENHAYWTYLGSLTTPPCNECVIWIVFKEAIEVSEEQLEAFRSLQCYAKDCSAPDNETKGRMVDNFRPALPRGDRLVRSSFN